MICIRPLLPQQIGGGRDNPANAWNCEYQTRVYRSPVGEVGFARRFGS